MAKPLLPNMPVTQTAFKLASNEMMVTEEMQKEYIVGVDLFIESSEQPAVIAKKCHNGKNFLTLLALLKGTFTTEIQLRCVENSLRRTVLFSLWPSAVKAVPDEAKSRRSKAS